MRKYGGRRLKPGWALDPTVVDPFDGEPWDLSQPKNIARLKKFIREGQPYVVIGSPPCTEFSSLKNFMKHSRDPEEARAAMAKATKHMQTCVEVYIMQIEAGRYFVHASCQCDFMGNPEHQGPHGTGWRQDGDDRHVPVWHAGEGSGRRVEVGDEADQDHEQRARGPEAHPQEVSDTVQGHAASS